MDDVLCPVLVGRDDELERLAARLARARGREGGVVLVLGEAGVGKSRLLRHLRAAGEGAGMVTLSGRAVDHATAPFRPLSEALIGARTADAAEEGNDPFAAILARLWGSGEPLEGGEVEQLALGEAVTRFLGTVTEGRGGLVVLEDVHWADVDTRAIIEYLADHLAEAPVLCVAAVRTGEGSPAERWARDLAANRVAELVELRPLEPSEVDAMAAACLDDPQVPPALSSFLRTRSEGVPLVVEELLAGLVSDEALVRNEDGWRVVSRLVPRVPLTLAESVQRRLGGLDPEDAEVVRAAAALGRRFDWSLLPAATSRTTDEVTSALRRAIELQLVGFDDQGQFRFRHALIRDAVLDQLLPPERAPLARAALDAVEQAHPDLEGDWCDLAADLAVTAGVTDRAVELLLEAARRAIAKGAISSAEGDIERARGLDSGRHNLELDELAAQAAALAGEVDRALELGRAVLDQAAGSSPARRSRLHLVLARALLNAGRWKAAADEAEAAANLANEADDIAQLAAAQAIGAQAAIADGRLDDARALAERAVEDGGIADAPVAQCEALEVLGRIERLHDVVQAEHTFERALAVAERHDLTLWRARALSELGTIDLFTTFRRDRLLEARKTAPPALLAVIELHLSSIGHARWEGEEAYEAAARCVDLSRRLGLATLGMGLIHLASAVALARRSDDELEALIAEALEVAGDEIDVVAGVPGRVRFMQDIMRADLAALRAHLDEAIEILRKDPSAGFPFRGLWALLRTLDDRDGATARREARQSAGGGIPINRNPIQIAEAVEAGRAGRLAEATTLAEESFAQAMSREGADAWRGLVRLVVAPAALRDGWGDGSRWLREALVDFEMLGLAELASACRAALRDAGQPVPRRGRGDSEVPPALKTMGVTSREMDVLRLLAEHLSNREIAERLSLSPRTVERHVANLLTKTGAADRHAVASLVDGITD